MEVHKCAPLNLWEVYPLEEISAHCGHGCLFRVTLQDAQRHPSFHATAGSLPPSPIPIIQSRPKTTPPVVGDSYALVWTQAQVNFQLNILPHSLRLVPTCTHRYHGALDEGAPSFVSCVFFILYQTITTSDSHSRVLLGLFRATPSGIVGLPDPAAIHMDRWAKVNPGAYTMCLAFCSG